jgi:hypothetical protein
MRAADSTNVAPGLRGRLALVAILVLSALATFSCGEEKPEWMAPDPCNLPYDSGMCTGSVDVWSYEAGVCRRRVFGGCDDEGNGNRFKTQEECMSVCEGRPKLRPCTGGRIDRMVCLSCSTTGGCGRADEFCAKPCTMDAECAELNTFKACVSGVCQVAGCL